MFTSYAFAGTSVTFNYNFHDELLKTETVEVDSLDIRYLEDVARDNLPKGYFIYNNTINKVSDTEYDVPILKNDLIHTSIEDIDDTIRIRIVYKFKGYIVKIRSVRIPDLSQVSWMLAYDYIDKLTEKYKPYFFECGSFYEGSRSNTLICEVK